MTSLQSMNGGNCNNGHENSSNNNLLLLQTSPVISNNSSQSLTVNNHLNHDNHQTNTITSSHITQDQQNNMSHINNGYQVNIHLIGVYNQTTI